MLELLLRETGRVVTRERALEEIWDDAAEPNVVDRYVTRLRRKLGLAAADPDGQGERVHAAGVIADVRVATRPRRPAALRAAPRSPAGPIR